MGWGAIESVMTLGEGDPKIKYSIFEIHLDAFMVTKQWCDQVKPCPFLPKFVVTYCAIQTLKYLELIRTLYFHSDSYVMFFSQKGEGFRLTKSVRSSFSRNS